MGHGQRKRETERKKGRKEDGKSAADEVAGVSRSLASS